MTLYNARSTELQGLLVTKWDTDGNIEAQYEVSYEGCTCPAGHRHTCRHRQMLPALEPLKDTHWFLDWDRHGEIVDFQGTPKWRYDAVVTEGPLKQDTLCVDEGCPQSNTEHVCVSAPASLPWRRI